MTARTFEELRIAAMQTRGNDFTVTPEEELTIKGHPDVQRYLGLTMRELTFCGRKLVVTDANANAILIAAAPELLNALKEATARLRSCIRQNATDSDEIADLSVAAYRELIRKIEEGK